MPDKACDGKMKVSKVNPVHSNCQLNLAFYFHLSFIQLVPVDYD